MKPKWQRARILRSDHFSSVVGQEIWTSSIYEGIAEDLGTHESGTMRCVYIAYTSGFDNQQLVYPLLGLELLARDENDFADDVPLIPWTEFLAQCQAASDRKRKDDHE